MENDPVVNSNTDVKIQLDETPRKKSDGEEWFR